MIRLNSLDQASQDDRCCAVFDIGEGYSVKATQMQEKPERADAHPPGDFTRVRAINTTGSVTPKAADPLERKML